MYSPYLGQNGTAKDWYSIYTDNSLEADFKDSIKIWSDREDCLFRFGKDLTTSACNRAFPCLLCQIPISSTYIVKGFCEDATKWVYVN